MLRLQPKHQKVNESLRAIRSQGARLLGPGSKISQNSKAKLIALYQTAQKQCVSEHSTIMQLLDNIQVWFFLYFKVSPHCKGHLILDTPRFKIPLRNLVGFWLGRPLGCPQIFADVFKFFAGVRKFFVDIFLIG